jgi:hypothetical protein
MQNSGTDMIVERAGFAFNMVDLVKDLESFEEAYHHLDVDKKIKWCRATSKFLRNESQRRSLGKN